MSMYVGVDQAYNNADAKIMVLTTDTVVLCEVRADTEKQFSTKPIIHCTTIHKINALFTLRIKNEK